jgi:hypothetical protein
MIKIYSNFSLHYTVDSASLMRMALFYMHREGNTSVRIERSKEDFAHFILDSPSKIDEIIELYFPPQKEPEKKIPLLREEYETYNEDGNNVATEFRNLLRGFIEEKMEKYSSIELEYILMGELSCFMSETRLTRNCKIHKRKKSEKL